MPSTCPSCDRSWDDSAAFCGRCGALLDHGRATLVRTGPRPRWWRHSIAVGVGATLAAAGAVLAVPSLSIDHEVPVGGEVGVPDTDDLPTASPVARVPPAVAAPEVTCHRGDVRVDCVAWSRDLAPPMAAAGDHGVGVLARGDRVFVLSGDGIQAAETATGTRRWRWAPPPEASEHSGVHPVGRVDGAMVLAGAERITVIDRADGEQRWTMAAEPAGWPAVVGDLVLTTSRSTGDRGAITARDVEDGTVAWRWRSPWPGATVQAVDPAGRVVVSDHHRVAVLDGSSGDELARTALGGHHLAGVVDAIGVVVEMPDVVPGAGSEPAEPAGAMIRGFDLRTGEPRWEHATDTVHPDVRLVGPRVFVVSDGGLRALDASTGQVAWEHDGIGRTWLSGSVELDDRSPPGPGVLVAGDPRVDGARAFDPVTGEELWAKERLSARYASVQGDLVVLFAGEDLYGIDAATGRDLVRVSAPGASVAGFHRGMVVLHHAQSGMVTAVDLPAVVP